MKWSDPLLFIILFTGFMSCGSGGHPEQSGHPKTDSTTVEATNSIFISDSGIDSSRLRLKTYFSDPLDFPTIKENFQMLEMGQILPKEFVPEMDSGHYNYNYGAIANLLKHSRSGNKFFPPLDSLITAGGLVSFSTYKPWTTAKEKYMSTNNELLIGYETKVSHPAFGDHDFVNAKKKEIVKKFGKADNEKNNCLIYFDSNSVLVLHCKLDKIDWFKFYRLNESVQSIDQLPDMLFHWNLRQNH